MDRQAFGSEFLFFFRTPRLVRLEDVVEEEKVVEEKIGPDPLEDDEAWFDLPLPRVVVDGVECSAGGVCARMGVEVLGEVAAPQLARLDPNALFWEGGCRPRRHLRRLPLLPTPPLGGMALTINPSWLR